MCRKKRHRKLRQDRVGAIIALAGVLLLAVNAKSTPCYCTSKTTTGTTNLSESTKFTLDEFDVKTDNIQIDKEHNVKKIDLYTSENLTKNEKKSMFDFYSQLYCKEYEDYYSQRLERYVSSFELYSLSRITYSEAGNQCLAGKTAVAATVLNRLQDSSGLFKNRIYEVIFQPEQFSSAQDGKYFSGGIEQTYQMLDKDILEDCINAAKNALDGEDPTNGALYFYNPEYCSDEELALRTNIPNVIVIGDHWFYKEW